MKIDQGTNILDVECGICGGTVTIVSGKREGDYLKGRCDNDLSEGGVCGTWFTVGKNPSFFLKQNFLKNQTQEAKNDNPAEIEIQNTNEPKKAGHANDNPAPKSEPKKRNKFFKG